MYIYLDFGFPGGTVAENLSASAGDAEDTSLILDWEDHRE